MTWMTSLLAVPTDRITASLVDSKAKDAKCHIKVGNSLGQFIIPQRVRPLFYVTI